MIPRGVLVGAALAAQLAALDTARAQTMPAGAPEGALARQEAPVFATRVEAVRVDTLVTEGGRPVRGLSLGDFELLDNGVPQRLDLASFEQIPLNVILAFDISNSVRGQRLADLRAAAASLVGALAEGDQAALVTFNHAVSVPQQLSPDRAWVTQALARPEGEGQTSLADAVFTALLLGESDVGRALVIVFSDGHDTASWLAPEAVRQIAARTDVVVYAVSVGGRRPDPFLAEMVEATGGGRHEATSEAGLGTVFLRVLEEFRQRYLISYTPTGVSPDGWHRLEVRVKGRRALVKARRGYLAGSALP
jgi:VWFA-related protein